MPSRDITFRHKMLDQEIQDLSTSNGATDDQLYYATDTNLYYTGNEDGTVSPLAPESEPTYVTVDAPVVYKTLPGAENIQLLRWNTGTIQEIDPNEDYLRLFTDYPRLVYFYFYHASFLNGYPGFFSKLQYFYSYYQRYQANESFADLPVNTPIRSWVNDYSWYGNFPDTIPASWANARMMNRIYFRRCNLSTAQVDSLITSFGTAIQNGLGNDQPDVYVYMNLTSSNSNAPASVPIHVADGWTANGGYLSKTINNKPVRIYHN